MEIKNFFARSAVMNSNGNILLKTIKIPVRSK